MKVTKNKMKRTPFLYLSLGFVSGVIISRNSAPMSAPAKGAIIIGIALVAWFSLRAGKRGQAEAVAVAVANATAIASAAAEANAKAVATQAVQIVLQTTRPTGVESAIIHDQRSIAEEAAHEFIEGISFDSDSSSTRRESIHSV